MPWKVWAPLEPVDAAPFNQFVQEQVVARFTSDAQRGTLLPTPLVGQLSSLEDAGAIDIWHEDAWQPAGARIVSWARQASKGVAGGVQGTWDPHNFSNAVRWIRPGYTWDRGMVTTPIDGFYRFSFSWQQLDKSADMWAKMVRNFDSPTDGNIQTRQRNSPPTATPTAGTSAGGFSQIHFCTAGEQWGVQIRIENNDDGGTVSIIDAIYSVEHLVAAGAPTSFILEDDGPDPSSAHLLDVPGLVSPLTKSDD